MNKKRLATLLLLACLTIGGAAVSTYSWFTAKTQATANLTIKTGTLNTEIQNDDKWVLESKGTSEVNNKDATNNFQNVRPGDAFVKTVTIRNIGSLKQKLTFTNSITLPDSIKNIFNVVITGATNGELAPNATMNVTIRLVLKGSETANTEQNKSIDFKTLNTADFVTVNATQVNAN